MTSSPSCGTDFICAACLWARHTALYALGQELGAVSLTAKAFVFDNFLTLSPKSPLYRLHVRNLRKRKSYHAEVDARVSYLGERNPGVR